jgi:hypothetical protein
MCLPIEQELVERCWLLLLALAGDLGKVAESVGSVAPSECVPQLLEYLFSGG